MEFYKKCWAIIKSDLIMAINHFHTRDRFEKSFNASYVALIPKENGAMELRGFGPISLIVTLYKVLSELLANRLRAVMDQLETQSQMAFILRRQITDASLIAYECLDSRMRKKEAGIVCKVDLEKVYDHVNCQFLLEALKLWR